MSTKQCPFCGEEINIAAKKCRYCNEWLERNEVSSYSNDDLMIKKIADYERTATILWLILAILQIVFVISIIAGIWNIIAVMSRWDMSEKIKKRIFTIPKEYKNEVSGLIIMGVVNLLLGGIIGVALVGFEFYIRNLVLENKRLFINKDVNKEK